ncbi:MAG: NADPH-dependent F420 reductase [Frankiaceae bacterium]
MRVAVIGTGNIGRTLGGALARAGHEVVFGARNPQEDAAGAGAAGGETTRDGAATVTSVGEAVAVGDVVLVAVPGPAVDAFVAEHRHVLDGKLVLDATNRIGGGGPANSAATYAELVPSARYARVFNTLGWENFADPDFAGVRPDMFFSAPAGDRALVEDLVVAVGLRPVYVGEGQHEVVDGVLRLWFALAVGQQRGRRLAFKMLVK